MIIIDQIPKKRSIFFRIFDYFWSGFATMSVVFALIALWQITHLRLGDLLLPSPNATFKQVYIILSNFRTSDIDITMFRAFVGISIAYIIGVFCGMIAGVFDSLKAFFRPIITILLSMPPIVIVVLALFWFGFGSVSTIFVVTMTIIPLSFANALAGMQTLDTKMKEMFVVYKLSFVKQLSHYYIPHLIPYLISALSLAFGMGIKIAIMAELLGANNGIGAKIAENRVMLDMLGVLAYVCIVLIISALVEYLFIRPLEIALTPWGK